MQYSLNRFVQPKQIVIRSLDAQGHEVSRQTAKNTVTYGAADIYANALLKSGPSQVTHLYARFGGQSANQGWLVPPNNDIWAVTRDSFTSVGLGDTVRGGLWVPILAAPAQNSTDLSKYQGNQATFYFRIPYNINTVTQTSPVGNFKANGDANDSYIYALGLAVARSSTDRTQDVIISVLQAFGYDSEAPTVGDFSAFSIVAGGQQAIDYPLPFVVQ